MTDTDTGAATDTGIDIDAVRRDTPGCKQVVHFNNAGASLMPEPVYRSVTDHLALEHRIGGYEAHAAAIDQVADFYTQFAQLLNAKPTEIAYIENATRAWDMAFYALPLKPGDRILTHESEYVSNYLALLQQAERRSLHIDLVPSDAHGQIDLAALQNAITPTTRVIALTHVPTQGGLVNPAEAVGRIAKDAGLIYLLDACQSVGQIELDVQKLHCDVLSGTGRKFLRGPRGTGFLYVRDSFLKALDPPFVDLHSATWTCDDGFTFNPDATRFENWESFYAGRIGLAKAVAYAIKIGLPAIEARVSQLGQRFREELDCLPGVNTHDQGERQCGLVTFSKQGVSAEAMHRALREQNINTSQALFTSARLDFTRRQLGNITRASVHYFNTDTEIESVLKAIDTV